MVLGEFENPLVIAHHENGEAQMMLQKDVAAAHLFHDHIGSAQG